MFLFSFYHEAEAKEVIQKAPRFIMNYLMCLDDWFPHVSCFDINFEKAPFWIQIHQLPLENINVVSAKLPLNKVGVVLEVDNPIVESTIL